MSTAQDGLVLSFDTLAELSVSTRKELLELMAGRIEMHRLAKEIIDEELKQGGAVDLDEDDLLDPEAADDQDEGQGEDADEPADLSVAQARKFLDRVSDKVYRAVRVIAEADPYGFQWSAIQEALGAGKDDNLPGVTGGITKRTRTVLGDPSASLIWWTQDEAGEWTGRVSAMTHRSLRKALALE